MSDTVKILNYMPLECCLRRLEEPEAEDVKLPSMGVARVEEEQTVVDNVAGYEVRKTVYKEITGLPEPEKDTYCVVSIIVAQANARSQQPRRDLFSPDAGNTCVRNEKGVIVAVTGFVTLVT
jgi:hypothetical protein